MAVKGPPPICFVLIDYDVNTPRHYNHLYLMIDRLAELTDVSVVAERGRGASGFRNVKHFRLLSWPTKILRRLELFLFLLSHRLRGWKVFYCHYAFAAARQATLITRLLGGRCYLWHCLMIRELDALLGAGRLRGWALHGTFRWIDRLVTGSEFMAGYYQREFGVPRHKIRVVPNYLEVSRFSPSGKSQPEARRELDLPADRPLVLFASDMVEGRAAALPDVVKQVSARRPEVLFILAGDGPYRQVLAGAFSERRVTGNVIQLGAVPNSEMWKYYRAADLFLHCSRFEAFTRTLLEAMAAGIPFVATDGGGGVPAYLADSQLGQVVPADRTGELAEKIVGLLEDPDRCRKLADQGLKHVKQFDISRVLEIFLEQVTG